MNPETHIVESKKTAAKDHRNIAERLSDPVTIDLLHAAIGMSTESGEILDMLKKHIFYGKEIDWVNLEEELGDSDWYQSMAIRCSRMKEHWTSWERIFEKNIAKLQVVRFRDGFDENAANKRDTEQERKVLEGK